MKIFLDPGHGGVDCGAVGQKGTYESAIVLEVSQMLGKMLSDSGHDVQYSRASDVFVGLSQRAKMANGWGADWFVSVHCNSFMDKNSKGTETFAYQAGTPAHSKAREVQDKLVQYLGRADRGVKTANFAVLRESKMPAVLVEIAFISNAEEEGLLLDGAFRQKAAGAVFEGITGEIYQTESEDLTMGQYEEIMRILEPLKPKYAYCDDNIPFGLKDELREAIDRGIVSCGANGFEPALSENDIRHIVWAKRAGRDGK
jgi:N-acetylmuramoyl-L-alanine amidase